MTEQTQTPGEDPQADKGATDTTQSSATPQSAETTSAAVPPHDSALNWKTRILRQLVIVVLALVAGAISAEWIYRTRDYLPQPELVGLEPYPPETIAAANRATAGNAMIGFALAGALVSAAVGAGLWLLRGSSRAAMTGVLVGLFVGAMLGALGGYLNAEAHRQVGETDLDELFKGMIIHSPFWLCLGLAVGTTVGLALRGVSVLSIVGATLGAAVLASLLFPLALMALFPTARPDRLVPGELGVRLLWFALGAGLIAWAAARSALRPRAASI